MTATQSRNRRHELGVLAIALVVRLIWALSVPVVPLSDCSIYDGAAQRLAKGLPYTIDAASTTPSAHWPVGTSLMYSLVYRVSDPATHGYAAAVVLNLLISLAVVALSMAVARKWFGPRAGVLTGLLMALWPMHIEFTTVIASEPVFTAFMLAGLLAWPRAATEDRFAKDEHAPARMIAKQDVLPVVIAGLCFAAATYARPTSLLFPGVLGGIEFLRTRRIVRPALQAMIAGAVILIALSPWTYRNYKVFHSLVLVSTNGGTNMWMGNNPETTGYYQMPPPIRPDQNEAQWDKDLGKQAKAYIRQEPVAFIKRSIVKAARLHDRETIGVAWNVEGLKKTSSMFDTGPGLKVLKALSSGYWYLMLALAAVGGVLLLRRDGWWRAITHPAIVFFAYFTAVHAIMVIQDRYHFPITPMVATLAALPLAALLNRRQTADPTPAA